MYLWGTKDRIEIIEVHVFPEGGRFLQGPESLLPQFCSVEHLTHSSYPDFPMQSKISLGFPTHDKTPS